MEPKKKNQIMTDNDNNNNNNGNSPNIILLTEFEIIDANKTTHGVYNHHIGYSTTVVE